MNETTIYDELRGLIGENNIKKDDIVLSTYGSDISVKPYQRPDFVILPEDREDVRKVLKVANKYKIPVTVMSGGVNITGLTVPIEHGIVLDLRRMDKILEINTDSGYAVIEPGVAFDRLTAALARKGFRCQVPTAPGGATALGNYLGRPSGSLCNRHLDPLLDLEVVLADGNLLKTGSSQFKTAGSSLRYGPHPDFTGLFCSSTGTLGVVTKAAIRIYPINESNRVHWAAFDNYESSVRYLKNIINNNIAEHCIIWSWTLCMSYNIVVPPKGGLPILPPKLKERPRKPPEGIPYNIVTTFMTGYEESMVTNENILARVAQKYGGHVIQEREAKQLSPAAWSAWKEFYGKYHQPRMEGVKKYGMGRYMAWIVCAEPEDIVKIESFAVDELYGTGAKPVAYYSMPFDFGRSMFFRLFTYVDTDDKELTERVGRTFKEMYDNAMENYGAVPFRYRAGITNDWLAKAPEFYNFYKKIKETLDPNNILNRNMQIF